MTEQKPIDRGFSRELVELINEKLSTSGDHYISMTDAIQVLCEKMGAERGLIKLYNRFESSFIQDITWPGGKATDDEDKVARMVIDCGLTPYLHRTAYDDNTDSKAIIGFPLSTRNYPLGAAVFTGASGANFGELYQSALSDYMHLLIVPAENILLQKALVESYLRTIESLALALEAKDNYTLGHSNMVMAYSLSLAQNLGLGKESYDAIEIGALMHDIGKIGVRDEVLRKVNNLTESEFDEIKQHPIIGEQILVPLKHDIMELPKKIVRWHHEMLNGKGYPDGVSGKILPIEVRIVSVADIFEALTSDRPYRKALDNHEAIKILKERIPEHLDSEIVAEMEKLVFGEFDKSPL